MAAGTAMVAVPPSVVRLLEAPEPAAAEAPARPQLRPQLVREWWIESGEDSVVVAEISDPVRRVILEARFIPPRGAVHVKLPPGREYPFEGVALRASRERGGAGRARVFHEMPLIPVGPQSGSTRATIGHAAGLEIYGGVVTVHA